jgi:hypothetical protein
VKFDGDQNIDLNNGLGAGLADSCSSCHGRPRGSAGSGRDVATRPVSRDAPHLFGLGLKEMLADEMTADLRTIRTRALAQAKQGGLVTMPLSSKGISYGSIGDIPLSRFFSPTSGRSGCAIEYMPCSRICSPAAWLRNRSN